MPSLEQTLLFLVVPAGALAGSATAVSSAFSKLKAQGSLTSPETAKSRLLVSLSASASIPVYGLILLFLVAGKEQEGGLSARDSLVLNWLSVTWASVSFVAIAVQGWTSRVRLSQLLGPTFGRVMLLIVFPLTSVVFALALGLLILGRIPLAATVSDAAVNSMVTALIVFAVSSLALPAAAATANRVQDLASGRDLVRAIRIANVGSLPILGAFVWAVLQAFSL